MSAGDPTGTAVPVEPSSGASAPQRLEELTRRAEGYFGSARAPNTVKAYRHDLLDFTAPHDRYAVTGPYSRLLTYKYYRLVSTRNTEDDEEHPK